MTKWKKDFLILWFGQAVSILSSAIIQMSIIWYLTDKTKSAAVLSVGSLVGFLPQAIIGPFVGVVIDRYNRKKIMILSDAIISALSLGITVMGLLGEIPVWFIMLILFGRSIGASFHNPSLQAVTPLIVPKEELTKYAGYSQGFESLSYLISPALAALLYSIWDLHVIVLLDVIGAAFAISTLSFITIPDVERIERKKTHFVQEFKEGFSVLRSEKGMLFLVILSGLYAMIYFPVGTYYPLITMTYFNGSFVESSIVEVLFSLGSLLGSFSLGIFGSKVKKESAIGKSIGVYGIGLLATGLLPPSGFRIFAVLSFVMGASVPFYSGITTSIFQTKFKPEYLGRVLSLLNSIVLFMMPLGLILAGTFAEVIGINHCFLLLGVFSMLLAVFSLSMSWRSKLSKDQ